MRPYELSKIIVYTCIYVYNFCWIDIYIHMYTFASCDTIQAIGEM